MLFSRKLVHNWYMASGWIKEKYETRSDITSLGTQKYESYRLCDGCLSIIGKINLLIDKWITWAYNNSRKHWTSAQRM